MSWKGQRLVPIFNLVALAIFLSLQIPVISTGRLQLFPEAYSEANTGLIGSYNFRLAGRFAIRSLTLALAISPLVYLFGWRRLIPLRKWAGLWAFAFAGLHVSFFFGDFFWRKAWGSTFVFFGLAALLILALMASTSHRPAMRLLGRNWKRLHRLVYIAGALVALHSINGMLYWKDIPNFEIAMLETQIYGFQIALLLLLRIPLFRRWLRERLRLSKRKRRKAKR